MQNISNRTLGAREKLFHRFNQPEKFYRTRKESDFLINAWKMSSTFLFAVLRNLFVKWCVAHALQRWPEAPHASNSLNRWTRATHVKLLQHFYCFKNCFTEYKHIIIQYPIGIRFLYKQGSSFIKNHDFMLYKRIRLIIVVIMFIYWNSRYIFPLPFVWSNEINRIIYYCYKINMLVYSIHIIICNIV